MVYGRAAEHEIERRVGERERARVAFLQQHVAHTGRLEPGRAQRQQRRGEIEGHDLAHVRRGHLGAVRGAARDLEHDHVLVERLQPREGGRRAAREQRVGAGEQARLLPERPAGDLVVSLRAHADHHLRWSRDRLGRFGQRSARRGHSRGAARGRRCRRHAGRFAGARRHLRVRGRRSRDRLARARPAPDRVRLRGRRRGRDRRGALPPAAAAGGVDPGRPAASHDAQARALRRGVLRPGDDRRRRPRARPRRHHRAARDDRLRRALADRPARERPRRRRVLRRARAARPRVARPRSPAAPADGRRPDGAGGDGVHERAPGRRDARRRCARRSGCRSARCAASSARPRA